MRYALPAGVAAEVLPGFVLNMLGVPEVLGRRAHQQVEKLTGIRVDCLTCDENKT
jgi:hypothetical protein